MLYTPETLALAGRANPILLEGRAPIIQAAQARALGLTDGQVVSAIAQVRGERLKLMLQGRAIDWPAGMRLKAGDTVALSAHLQANGSWLLKPLTAGASRPDAKSAPSTSGAPTTSAYAPLAHADAAMSARLSSLLARAPDTRAWTHLFQSGALSQLVSALGSSVAGTASAQPGATPTGRGEWFDLWPALRLSMASLSPTGLREAMLANGLSAEALLARGSAAAAQDTKTLLRNLLRKLGPAAPNSAVVREALDDLERAQVEAVQALDRRELSFSMVLPFIDADPIDLRFKRPARNSPDDPAVFTVDVHTNNQRLGELWLRTVITPPSAPATEPPSVDMTMWAIRDDVARAARLASADLADELEAKGLAMATLQVFNAPRPASTHAWQPPHAGTVLDVNA